MKTFLFAISSIQLTPTSCTLRIANLVRKDVHAFKPSIFAIQVHILGSSIDGCTYLTAQIAWCVGLPEHLAQGDL